jgi:hypothetical protein
MNPLLVFVAWVAAMPMFAQAQVWRCETDSGVPLYQNVGGPRCKPLDLPVITTLPAPQPGPGTGPARATLPASPPTSGAAPAAAGFPKVDPAAQRARDQERREILETEMRKEESRLAELRAEYQNGEPERRGDERNYQRYLDRVQRLKDEIARSENAIGSLRRELAALRP